MSRPYQTPPVSSFAMTNTLNNLRRQILWCATVGVRFSVNFISRYALLRETEISYLNVTLVIQQDVFWL